jgi:hypothetical protein
MYSVLTDTSLRSQLLQRGRLRAAAFTWERAGRQTLDLLMQVAGASTI